jgi:hypothetical protein
MNLEAVSEIQGLVGAASGSAFVVAGFPSSPRISFAVA